MSLALRAALVWRGTIVSERVCTDGPLLVGDSPTAHFNAPLPGDEVLAEVSEDAATICVERGATLTVRATAGLARHEGPTDIELEPGDSGILHAGDLAVFFQWVDMSDTSLRGGYVADYNILSAVSGSAAAHAAFLVAAFLLAEPSVTAAELEIRSALVSILVADPPDAIEEVEIDVPEVMTVAAGSSASGEEGRMGAEDAEVEETTLAHQDGDIVENLEDTELGIAINAAIGLTGAMTQVFGQTDSFADSFGTNFALAGEGEVFIVGRGPGGLASQEYGPGGGGTGPPRFTNVGGLEGPPGPGTGASMRTRSARAPSAQMTRSRPTVSGFLPASAIERVVRRHASGLRHCYERELLGDSSLGGRVSANWTIGLDGRVSSVSIIENGLSSAVGTCMAREIRRMHFDQPDGGMVVVTYPFTFRSAES